MELIERDDDFGDGWYLGKHLQNGRSGLFPEGWSKSRYNKLLRASSNPYTAVYTTVIPQPPHMNTIRSNTRLGALIQESLDNPRLVNSVNSDHEVQSLASIDSQGAENPTESESVSTVAAPEFFELHDATPPPLNTTPPLQRTNSVPNTVFPTQTVCSHPFTQRSISMTMGNARHHGEDSPVMNETLSVIDEHIIDLNTPRSSLLAVEQRGINDSGSEYSNHIDHRLSYINGHETDEEERNAHTEEEVTKWTPAQVAEYLEDVGVESRHCEVFMEQEISGEVLLGMDQSSVFMKELNLGLVGRRLRTWHKIKALQEEVRANKCYDTKSNSPFGGNTSPGNLENTNRGSMASATLPRIPSLLDRPGSKLAARHSQQESQRNVSQLQSASQLQVPSQETTSMPSTATFRRSRESLDRPSAASVRELNHSRRHSSVGFTTAAASVDDIEERLPLSPTKGLVPSHRKQPSFDRNWTMGNLTPAMNGRPTSTVDSRAHSPSLSSDCNTFDPMSQGSDHGTSPLNELDRGYTSGGEVDVKKSRNVLRKRDVVSASHSRQSSHKEEQQQRRITTGSKRQSRLGSGDSIRDTLSAMTSPASKMHLADSLKSRFGTPSIKESGFTAGPPKDVSSPIVTKLDYANTPRTSLMAASPKLDKGSPVISQGSQIPQVLNSQSSPKSRISVRANSAATQVSEKTLVASPSSIPPSMKDFVIPSPTRTGSTTTSGASKSFEMESPDASSPKGTDSAHTGVTPPGRTTRRKSKKQTSAYTRGLVQKSPYEQMVDCDYSGWMKKKSPSLMATWKPRLFVLRGRRLSYYYTENDTEEKGLIDISSHRVLPADNEKITGLHATFTGAKSSPTSPSNAQTPTINSTEAASQPVSTIQKANMDSTFIFKLVPPRTGLSRAVNFTKPTVHYFAVDNVTQGRLWMAALMKATIDRDDSEPIISTYQQKTISLAKAKAQRHRPPALMGLDEKADGTKEDLNRDETGLNIQGLGMRLDGDRVESDKGSPGVIGLEPEQTQSPPLSMERKQSATYSMKRRESKAGSQRGRKNSAGQGGGVEILLGAMQIMS